MLWIQLCRWGTTIHLGKSIVLHSLFTVSRLSRSSSTTHAAAPHRKGADKSNVDSIKNVNNPKIFIPKNDKRRTYAKVFADAFNSCDVKTLFKYLETYCTKDCLLIQQCIGKENPFIPKYVEVVGINAILEFWRSLFMTVPDALMVMLESKLRVKHIRPQVVAINSNSSGSSAREVTKGERHAGPDTVEVSCIVSSFSFTGTKLYQFSTDSNSNSNGNTAPALESAAKEGSASNSTMATTNKDGVPQLSRPPELQYTESIVTATAAAAAEITTKKTKKRPLEVTAGELLRDISAKYNPMPGTVYQSSILPSAGSGNLAHTISNMSVINKIMPSGNARYKDKASNYMLINSNSRLAAGDLILPANSHLDFLGTMNMYLDAEMKIIKIEFVYSPTD